MKKAKRKIGCDLYEIQNPHGKCRIDGAKCHVNGDAEQCNKVVLIRFTVVDDATIEKEREQLHAY